jgi:hypothetical protein
MANVSPGPASFQDVVIDVATAVVHCVAPEELVVLPETAREFFADPQSVLGTRERDEPLGFGIDLALLSPYVLAVGGPVVSYLASVVGEAGKDAAVEVVKPVIAERIRGLLRRSDASVGIASGAAAPPVAASVLPSAGASQSEPVLSVEQVQRVRELARDRARAVGLADAQADLLADAFVGCLSLRG